VIVPNVISPAARISPLALIEESSRGSRLEIADDAFIDAFVAIKFVGGSGDVTIGPESYLNAGTVVYSGNGLTLGARVMVAANCTFAPTNHEFERRDIPMIRQRFRPSRGGILVEDDVWIGANSVILDGAILRRGCIVGAGSVVRGELLPYSINFGTPARFVRWRPNGNEPM
jgi:acetyltransferase-like isoleucine patch superfamily enzyme